MIDSKQKITEKKIVSFTVRFDSALFDRLEKHMTSIPRAKRPSKYGFIQTAVERAISVEASPLRERLTISAQNHDSISVEGSEVEWIKKLLAALRCGDAEVVQAISSNLAVFWRIAAQVTGRERGGTPIPNDDSASLEEETAKFIEESSKDLADIEKGGNLAGKPERKHRRRRS